MKSIKNLTLGLFILLLSGNLWAATLPSNCQTQECKTYFEQFKLAAKRGHPQAMATLGQFYYHAYGTERNVGEALRQFKRASRKGGDSAAQLKAGLIYLSEDGFKDVDEGIKYLKKAAKKDYKAANFVLGMIYFDPAYGRQDYSQADKYFAKAYKQKMLEAGKVALYVKQENEVSPNAFPKLMKAQATEPLVTLANGEIEWPRDEMEVITVTSPPLETVLREQLVTYRRPIKTTGTRFTGKSCAENAACYASDGVQGMEDYTFMFISYGRSASGQGGGRLGGI